MSIRTKFFLLLGVSQVLLVVIILTTFFAILSKLRDDPIEKITYQLAAGFKRELYHKESKMRLLIECIITNPIYSNLMVDGMNDRKIFHQNIEIFKSLMIQNGLSIFEIGDKQGKVYFRVHRPKDFGDDKSNQKIIKEALGGKFSSTLEVGKSGIGLRATGPIKNSLGTILIGQVVDQEFLSEISGSNLIHLALYQDKQLIAVSSNTTEDILNQVKSPLKSRTFLEHQESIYYTVRIPYEGQGLSSLKLNFLVFIDETELQNSTKRVWFVFFTVGSMIFSAIFFISYLFSTDIIKAVKLLAYSMRNFETKDEDLLDVNRKDELGEIALFYIDMKKELLLHQNHLQELVEQKTKELKVTNKNLEEERNKTESLLQNILPAKVAEELKNKGYTKPILYESVSVMFTDFVGFTHLAESVAPDELVSQLDESFKVFDFIIAKHKLEKLKTIGDGYMCAGGLPEKNNTHSVDICLAALEINDYMKKLKIEKEKSGKKVWELRIGINTGSLVAGVVGNTKFAYDVWGDTVNIASRMESSGENGKVNISPSTYELVKDFFEFEYRGKVSAKRKGDIDMYFLLSIKPDLLENKDEKVPNYKFWNLYKELEKTTYSP